MRGTGDVRSGMTKRHFKARAALDRLWAGLHLHFRAAVARYDRPRGKPRRAGNLQPRPLRSRKAVLAAGIVTTLANVPAALDRLWAKLHLHFRAAIARYGLPSGMAGAPRRAGNPQPRAPRGSRKVVLAAGIAAAFVTVLAGGLCWRLASGPVSIDALTPWLTAAVEERLGGRHRIEVGGTQIERTDAGRTALRLRDIVVRDLDGAIVATAPKAEVGISTLGLLTGHIQARRLSLIGAAMAVRIDRDGELSIFAGSDKRPIATASGAIASANDTLANAAPTQATAGSGVAISRPGSNPPPPAGGTQQTLELWSIVRDWMDWLDALGLGRELSEVGLQNGSVLIDDLRTGKRWSFAEINLTLTRPKEGGVALAVGSKGTDGAWSLTATVTPRENGIRAVEAVLRDFSPKDLLLALRVADGASDADMPISAILRAEIGPDGVPLLAEGRVLLGAGYVGNPDDPADRILVDEVRADLKWDPAQRRLTVPLEILSGANRISVLAHVGVPDKLAGTWTLAVPQGLIMLASADRTREAPLVLDHMALRGRLDPSKRRFELDQGDLSGMPAGVAFSGALDYSGPELRLTAGLAGNRMSAASLKRIWPVFVASKVRDWVGEHVQSGTVERLVIAVNSPLVNLKASGPPVPDDGLSIELVSTGVAIRPVLALPLIRDADVTMSILGRRSTVRIGRGVAELSAGRRLTVSNVTFEVPDTFPRAPPARLRFHADGGLDAAAELVGMEPLRDSCDLQLDPATSRGSLAANITAAFPITADISRDMVSYGVEADFSNFSAESLVRGRKVEAGAMHLSASSQLLQVKGDVRIAGVPANVDYRILNGTGDAEVRAQATLDEAARSRLGVDARQTISGPIPLKVNGRIEAGDRGSRLNVEADLAAAKIEDTLPGWIKPRGKPGKASFVVLEKPSGPTRFEDVLVESAGTLVKGSMEVDKDGEITLANFPTFATSYGDKATLRAERGSDGVLKVALRGDVYDGRGFLKSVMSGSSSSRPKRTAHGMDVDAKIGAMAGFNGELLRSLDLRLSKREGHVQNFSLHAKLGEEATLSGDLRGYANGRSVIYLETNDAGALFRLTDTYPRVSGGEMWLAMDPPSDDEEARDGVLNVRDFVVRGEPALERLAAADPVTDDRRVTVTHGVSFSRFRVEFTRSPGKLALRDGVVWGSTIGATMEGQLDYAHDDVRVRGTFIPAYGLNNMFGRLPLVGPLLGGQKEGLVGVTYEVAGSPHAPVLRVNPMSVVAPGFLRKLFEFRGASPEAAVPEQLPTR
jgi:hypothetical protein